MKSKRAYLVGSVAGLLLFFILLSPAQARLRMIGPANTGHENLECADCHEAAEGTPRQQIQANVRHLIGLRDTGVDFQHEDVTSQDCLACHARPDDRHPIFRFNEPRFAEARAEIGANDCVSCHLEHQGERATIEPTFCINCHEDLTLKNDPLDVSHEQLIAIDEWQSCLGCHDFHGNHVRETQVIYDERIPNDVVVDYLKGGKSPYSAEKKHQAQESR